MNGKPIDLNESINIAFGVAQGKVVMSWANARTEIVFDGQAAFEFAEQIARAAHQARFPGEPLSDDFHYLAQQIKQRLTDDMRDRLALRIRTMLPSLLAKDMNYASMQIVDTIFSALDAESYTRLDPNGGAVLG